MKKIHLPDSVPIQLIPLERRINELRKAQGLPPRRTQALKRDGTISYLHNPDEAEVTGVRAQRGYTYLNLNGGDSFGYWHPDDNFEYIYNFKGEPVYKTSEIAPSYYTDRLRRKRQLLTGVRSFHVFRDAQTDTYYAGWYDPNTHTCHFDVVSSKAKLNEFLLQYALPPEKIIHDWTCTFDPNSLIQVDPKLQYWNRFQPSRYMAPGGRFCPNPPPTILALLVHVLGAGPESLLVRGFLNWLAFAFQKRTATGTAWLLQGVPGTGKGLLAHHVLKPLFGPTNFSARRLEELEDKFNGHLENCLMCYVDEVNIGISKRADMILANLKNQITEPVITIRRMRTLSYEAPNYLNWVMSSNTNEMLTLDKEDRRFNVGAYQLRSIRDLFPDTAALVALLTAELDGFAAFLQQFVVDLDQVRTPIRNEARQELIDSARTSLDIIGDAILQGDLELLASYISTGYDVILQIRADSYLALLRDIAKTRRTKLTRDEMRIIFLFTVGDVPATPAKFSRFLTHRGIKLKKIRVLERTTVGIEVEWVCSEELRNEIITGHAPPLLTVVKTKDDNDDTAKADP